MMIAAVGLAIGIALPPSPWGRDGRRGAAGAEGSSGLDGGRRPGRRRSGGGGAGDGFFPHFSPVDAFCEREFFFFASSFFDASLDQTHTSFSNPPPALVPVPIKLERPWYVPPVFDPQGVSAAESERRASAKECLDGRRRREARKRGKRGKLASFCLSLSLAPSRPVPFVPCCCRPYFGSSVETLTSILESQPEA